MRGPLGHLARVELGHRCLACEWTAAIAKPRRAEREEARRGEIALRLRDAEPESLEIRDRPAELPPLLRVSAGDLERAACDPDGLRRDADAPAIESGHRDREAFPHVAQHRVGADDGVLHDERARIRRAQAELVLRWSYGHSRCVQRQHERGDARARALRVELAGAREHDRERGVARVRDELLSPVDAPAVPVRPRRRPQRCGVAPRRRLGEGKRPEPRTVHELRQPAPALLVGRASNDGARDDAAVDGNADRERGPCGGELLEDKSKRDRRRPEATVGFWDRHPQHA